ncbi:MAG: ABC transporter permease [Acidobacteriaceae bacterium]|nr:ABC transporter permease [Acidobacteriaceae bacterium]
MFRYLPLAFKNTLRNPRRSILTIANMAVSLCLLSVMIAMYHALFYNQQTPGQALRLVVRHRVSLAQPLPVAYEAKVRTVPGVREVSVWNWFGGTYKDNRDPKNFFARFGVEPKAFLTIRTQMVMPEDQRKAFIEDRTGCVVSKDLADEFHLKLGDRIILLGDIYPVNLELKLVGIFDDPDAIKTLYFNYNYLRDALPLGRRNFISVIAVLADTPEDVPRIAKTVDTMFDNSAYPTRSESEQQFLLSFVSFIGNIKLFLLSICAAVTFTILLVSGNTMAMSVRERIREVGVMKTLGYTNGLILLIIIGEALAIALAGGVLGLILAEGATGVVGKVGQNFIQELQGLTVTPVTIVISLLVAAFVGAISSIVPAWNAAKTDILTSLRYTG